jgi:starch phosphorylase
MERQSSPLSDPKIAYFSMEIGLTDDIPTYSGGLGVLAGDLIRSSADLNLPVLAITLVSKKGYFRQDLTDSGQQVEYPDPWDPATLMTFLPETVSIQIQKCDVKVKAWRYEWTSPTGGVVPIFFLDTDVEGNRPEDREITHFLYGGDYKYRLKQEIVLGIGGVKMLDALGFDVRRYHMNEGHSSLLSLELLRRCGMDLTDVREKCIFTTHTPVEAGQDKFPYDVVQEIMGDIVSLEVLKNLGGQDRLNMTLLALNLSGYHNGVTKKHREVSEQMFPSYEISAITNGIHSYTWTCPSFREIYNTYLPGWANEPELLVRVDNIPDEEIWQAHIAAKQRLIDHVNEVTHVGMEYDVFTLGFARRSTAYKRSRLLFSDLKRLESIGKRSKLQIVFAGKSHPRNHSGKQLIEAIFRDIHQLRDVIKIVYLKNYGLGLAARMVSGVDVWLNTPLRPFEASGTSGMKAAHNGVINFSVLDGWWIEGWIENVTGWAIGPCPDESISQEEVTIREVDDLYNKLEYIILPMFYQRRDEWIRLMENSIGKIAYYFNSHRMMRRYVTEAYF